MINPTEEQLAEWMQRYYPQNTRKRRLSDLAQQQTYSRPLPPRYEVLTNGGNTKYMDEGTYNNYMGAIDSTDDPYSKMDAYRNLMRGLR